jgi:hypothetical protein
MPVTTSSHDQGRLTIPLSGESLTGKDGMLCRIKRSPMLKHSNRGIRGEKTVGGNVDTIGRICLFYKHYNNIVTMFYFIKITTVLYCLFYQDYNSTISTVWLFYLHYNSTVKYCLFIKITIQFNNEYIASWIISTTHVLAINIRSLFSFISSRPHFGPGVDSASKRNGFSFRVCACACVCVGGLKTADVPVAYNFCEPQLHGALMACPGLYWVSFTLYIK